MIYDDERRAELTALHARADAKLAQALTLIGRDLAGLADDPVGAAAERLEGLETGQFRMVQIRAAVAYAELKALLVEMNRHLDAITEDMGHTTRHNHANLAYRQTRLL